MRASPLGVGTRLSAARVLAAAAARSLALPVASGTRPVVPLLCMMDSRWPAALHTQQQQTQWYMLITSIVHADRLNSICGGPLPCTFYPSLAVSRLQPSSHACQRLDDDSRGYTYRLNSIGVCLHSIDAMVYAYAFTRACLRAGPTSASPAPAPAPAPPPTPPPFP